MLSSILGKVFPVTGTLEFSSVNLEGREWKQIYKLVFILNSTGLNLSSKFWVLDILLDLNLREFFYNIEAFSLIKIIILVLNLISVKEKHDNILINS